MPINEVNGKHTFDPAKRIRAAVGEEVTEELSNESLDKIYESAMANSTAVRNNMPNIEVDSNDKENNKSLLNDVIHSNSNLSYNGDSNMNERKEMFYKSKEVIDNMYCKKNVTDTIGHFLTGFDKKQNKSYNISNGFNLSMNFIYGACTNFSMDDLIDSKDPTKNKFMRTLFYSAFDGFRSSHISFNYDEINNVLFDPDCITQNEGKVILSNINKEKIKYSIEHVSAGILIPAAAKLIINKVLPSELNHNKVIKAATSFGTFSTIGKTALMITRNINDKKLYNKISNTLDYSDDVEKNALNYGNMAKLAIRKSIDNHLDQTIIPGIGGSVISTIFRNKLESFNNNNTVAKNEKIVTVTPTVKVTKEATVKPASKKLA